MPDDSFRKLDSDVEDIGNARDATLPVGAPGALVDEAGDPTNAPSPGAQLGRYEVIEELGAGAMGVVFRARDPSLDRDVAVKLLRSGYGRGDDSQGRARLVREARAMAAIGHPNVIEIYDVGVSDGAVFFAMELVEGSTLKGWLRSEARKWPEILTMFERAGRGLEAAHACGLVHRDFKPDNVLIDRSGRVAVTDFGIVSTTVHDLLDVSDPSIEHAGAQLDSSATASGAVMGTPAYMSPEQHKMEGTDARSDQFAYCVALWEALYGRRPFPGRGEREIRRSLLDGRLEPPPENTMVPHRVELALRRGLGLDAESRWPTMDALLTALQKAARPRWGAWTAAGGLFAAGAAIVAWPASEAPPGPCLELEARVIRPFDPNRGAKAFEAASGDQGLGIWGQVAPRLQSYSDAWGAQRKRLCGGAPDDTPEVAARVQCLEEALSRFNTTVEVFENPDPGVVTRALHSLDALPPPKSCDDANVGSHIPQDPRLAAAVGEARRAQARVYTLEDAGLYAEALEEARVVLSRAEQLGFEPFLAEMMYSVARLLDFVGEYKEATRRLEEAAWYALEHGREYTAAQAMTELVFVLSARHGDGEAALRWAARAEPVAARLKRQNTAAWLGHNKAIAYRLQGRLEESREAHLAAIEIQEDILDPDSTALAAARANYSEVLRALGRREEAREQIQKAFDSLERVSGADHPETVSTMSKLGELYITTGDRAQGRNLLLRAERIWKTLAHPGDLDMFTIECNLASLAAADGNYDDARRRYRKALEFGQTGGNDAKLGIGWALTGLASVALEVEDFATAEAGYTRVAEFYERMIPKGIPTPCVSGLGLAQVALGRNDFVEARRLANEAVQWCGQPGIGGRNAQKLPHALRVLGEVQRESGEGPAAVATLRGAVAKAVAVGVQPMNLTEIELALAKTHHATHNSDEARRLAVSSLRRLSTLKPPPVVLTAKVETFIESLPDP